VDELPQLCNVFKGDMSLVGPRPLLADYLTRYTSFQRRRHEVKPGITGLAQIHGRNAVDWPRKFELDVQYVDTWTLGLDFRILAITAWNLIRGKEAARGAYDTIPEFSGPEFSSALEGPVAQRKQLLDSGWNGL
jgi:lipopolysaccharide/colanic/teichoic acid biosynthesis glycosyltransferase